MPRTSDTRTESPPDTSTGPTAIVAKRAAASPVETDEIRALTSAAGYDAVEEATQVGPEDPGTHFGSGKVAEIARLADDRSASVVVVDGELTPGQHHAIQADLPDGTRLFDRYRLVLEIFAERSGTKRAQLQVELATLRYELPRIEAEADGGALNSALETGLREYDVRDRIDRLERRLEELPDPADRFRKRRSEQGFDLLTIAGYTNAGKSSLLHRLADDMHFENAGAVESDDGSATHRDEADVDSMKDATAAVEDRLFETLETTTRRATIDGRPVLATDTIGFVDDLPHELVASFSSTLSEAAGADVVVLVADASDPTETFCERLDVSLDVLDELGVDDDRIVTALNKVDLLTERERDRRLAVATDREVEPILVSIHDGTGLDALREAIGARLPTARATLEMPNCDDAMRLVSEAYDRTVVDGVDYEGGRVTLVCRGRPSVVERLQATAESITG